MTRKEANTAEKAWKRWKGTVVVQCDNAPTPTPKSSESHKLHLKLHLAYLPNFFPIWTRVLNHNKYVEIKQFSKSRHQTK